MQINSEFTTDAPAPYQEEYCYIFVMEDGTWDFISATDDQSALMIFQEKHPNDEIVVVFECDHIPREVL